MMLRKIGATHGEIGRPGFGLIPDVDGTTVKRLERSQLASSTGTSG
jgi:hypothetical protein